MRGNDNYYATRVYRNPLEVTGKISERRPIEVGWYRRVITIPLEEPWVGKRVIPDSRRADFFTERGQWSRLGEHEGGYTRLNSIDRLVASRE